MKKIMGKKDLKSEPKKRQRKKTAPKSSFHLFIKVMKSQGVHTKSAEKPNLDRVQIG